MSTSDDWEGWENAPEAKRPTIRGNEPLDFLEESTDDNSGPKRPKLKRPSSSNSESKDSAPKLAASTEQEDDESWGSDIPEAGAPVISVSDEPSVKENVIWVEAGTSLPVVGGVIEDDDEDDFDDSEDEEIEPEKTSKSTSKKRSSKSKKSGLGGIRLTDRDKELLEFLGRYRFATVSQISRRFNTSEKTLRNRLPKLRDAGLVDSVFMVHNRPQVWLVTTTGLSTVGMNLTAPKIKWGQVRHTLWLVELGIAFENAGENVLTEREIRAAATRYSPTPRMRASVDFYKSMELMEEIEEQDSEVDTRVTSALTVPVPGRGIGHIPDMVLARQPFPNGYSGSIAVELELTRKNLGEWRTILTAFRDSDRFAEVYYYVTNSEVKRAMNRVVKALGAEEKIHILMFEPIDETARMFTGSE